MHEKRKVYILLKFFLEKEILFFFEQLIDINTGNNKRNKAVYFIAMAIEDKIDNLYIVLGFESFTFDNDKKKNVDKAVNGKSTI